MASPMIDFCEQANPSVLTEVRRIKRFENAARIHNGLTSNPERWRFSTKVTPDRFIELTDFPGVKPARYRGRFHWVTIVEVHRFPAAYLTELVEWSYQTAFASLSKARKIAFRPSHA